MMRGGAAKHKGKGRSGLAGRRTKFFWPPEEEKPLDEASPRLASAHVSSSRSGVSRAPAALAASAANSDARDASSATRSGCIADLALDRASQSISASDASEGDGSGGGGGGGGNPDSSAVGSRLGSSQLATPVAGSAK